jgi:hypothetical protein
MPVSAKNGFSVNAVDFQEQPYAFVMYRYIGAPISAP